VSLLDDLKVQRQRLSNERICSVCRWLETQDPSIKSAMEDWIKDGLSREKLLWVCQGYGLDVKQTTFRKHVRECLLKVRDGSS
jgi:hypothetical protein